MCKIEIIKNNTKQRLNKETMVETVKSKRSTSRRYSNKSAKIAGAASLSTASNSDSSKAIGKAEHIFKIIGSTNNNKPAVPAAASNVDDGEAYIRRIFTDYEKSSNKAKSASSKAERVA